MTSASPCVGRTTSVAFCCPFSGLAARVTVYGSTDDYGGDFLTNPSVPYILRRVHKADVTFGRHSVVGAGSVILPGAEIGEGCAIGSMSLVKGTLEPFGVYAGVPATRIRDRSMKLLELEKTLLGGWPGA